MQVASATATYVDYLTAIIKSSFQQLIEQIDIDITELLLEAIVHLKIFRMAKEFSKVLHFIQHDIHFLNVSSTQDFNRIAIKSIKKSSNHKNQRLTLPAYPVNQKNLLNPGSWIPKNS